MKTPNKVKQKRVKAWAILGKRDICQAHDRNYGTWYNMIYDSKKDAERTLRVETRLGDPWGWIVVPVTITYSLPSSPKNKR